MPMDDVLDQSLSVAVPARTSNAPATGAERIVVGRPGWTERATQRGGERARGRERKPMLFLEFIWFLV